MTGQRCHMCGNTKAKDPSLSFHRIPKDAAKKTIWLAMLGLCKSDLKQSTSRHFPGKDSKQEPSLFLGEQEY